MNADEMEIVGEDTNYRQPNPNINGPSGNIFHNISYHNTSFPTSITSHTTFPNRTTMSSTPSTSSYTTFPNTTSMPNTTSHTTFPTSTTSHTTFPTSTTSHTTFPTNTTSHTTFPTNTTSHTTFPTNATSHTTFPTSTTSHTTFPNTTSMPNTTSHTTFPNRTTMSSTPSTTSHTTFPNTTSMPNTTSHTTFANTTNVPITKSNTTTTTSTTRMVSVKSEFYNLKIILGRLEQFRDNNVVMQKLDKKEREKLEEYISKCKIIVAKYNSNGCTIDEIQSVLKIVKGFPHNISIDVSEKPTPLPVYAPPPQKQEALVHVQTINQSLLRQVNKEIELAFEPTLKKNLNGLWKIMINLPCEICRELHPIERQKELLGPILQENEDSRNQIVLYFGVFCFTLRLVLTRYPDALETIPKDLLIKVLLTHSHLVDSTLMSDIVILIVNNDAINDDDLKNLIVSPLITLLTEDIISLSSLDMATFILTSVLLPSKGDPSPVSRHAVECIEQNIPKFNYSILGRESFLKLFLPFLSSKLLQKGDVGKPIYYLSLWVSSLVKSKFNSLSKKNKFYLIQIISKLIQFSKPDITKPLGPTLGEIQKFCITKFDQTFPIFMTEYFSTLMKLVETNQIDVFKELVVSGFNTSWINSSIDIYENHVGAFLKKLLYIMYEHKVLTQILPDISEALITKIVLGERKYQEWKIMFPIEK